MSDAIAENQVWISIRQASHLLGVTYESVRRRADDFGARRAPSYQYRRGTREVRRDLVLAEADRRLAAALRAGVVGPDSANISTAGSATALDTAKETP